MNWIFIEIISQNSLCYHELSIEYCWQFENDALLDPLLHVIFLLALICYLLALIYWDNLAPTNLDIRMAEEDPSKIIAYRLQRGIA